VGARNNKNNNNNNNEIICIWSKECGPRNMRSLLVPIENNEF